jgi:tetratricopeptide (TPR) repeat protein
MKYLLLLTGFLMMHSVSASEHETLFERANQYYASAEYDSAFYLYEGLVLEQIEDAALYFNFANTQFQLGRYAEAVAWYERTLRLSPKDEAAAQNLSAAKQQLGIVLNEDGGLLKKFRASGLPPWFAIGFFWVAVFVGLIGLFWANRSNRMKWFSAASAALVIAMLMAWQTYLGYIESKAGQQAIAIEEAAVYAHPAKVSEEVYEVSPGQKVAILKQDQHWYYVQITPKRKGWVHASCLVLI